MKKLLLLPILFTFTILSAQLDTSNLIYFEDAKMITYTDDNKVTVKFTTNFICNIVLYDEHSLKVASKKIGFNTENPFVINLNELVPTTYIFFVQSQNRILIKRLIVNNPPPFVKYDIIFR
jgi:hypothetical protein